MSHHPDCARCGGSGFDPEDVNHTPAPEPAYCRECQARDDEERDFEYDYGRIATEAKRFGGHT